MLSHQIPNNFMWWSKQLIIWVSVGYRTSRSPFSASALYWKSLLYHFYILLTHMVFLCVTWYTLVHSCRALNRYKMASFDDFIVYSLSKSNTYRKAYNELNIIDLWYSNQLISVNVNSVHWFNKTKIGRFPPLCFQYLMLHSKFPLQEKPPSSQLDARVLLA